MFITDSVKPKEYTELKDEVMRTNKFQANWVSVSVRKLKCKKG